MTGLIVVPRATEWQKLKRLVLDSVSSPITRRVYNLGLDEFFEWFGREPRPGFTKATVSAWRVALEARGLGDVSINVRITAVRKLAIEAADNGLLAPELASGITRVKGVASKGVRVGNWLSVQQAQKLLNAPDATMTKGLRDRAILAVLLGCGLRRSEVAALTVGHVQQRDGRWCIVDLVGKHDIEVIRPHLRVTSVAGTLYPCPKPRAGYCPRRIVDYGNGQFAAICRDPHEICESVPLTQRDVLLQELDVASFARFLAGPLGIRWQEPIKRDDGTWGIGLSDRRDSRARPTFLVLLPETRRFVAALQRLLLTQPGPFVVITPTSRHRTIEVQEMLQARGISFLALEEHLLIDDEWRLVAVDPQDQGGAIRPTAQQDRRRVVKEFVARNHCKVKDIQEAAGVDEADYYKWLNGKTPDHYSTCVAIEKVLQNGLPANLRNARE